MSIKIKKAKLLDVKTCYDIDKSFYSDAFFTIKDYTRMIEGKSINKVVVAKSDEDIIGILVYCRMPKTKHLYITSLASKDKKNVNIRKLLLEYFLGKKAKRYYTHGKKKWGLDKVLLPYGFVKVGKGDTKDEPVEFLDDITKLDLYELKIKK